MTPPDDDSMSDAQSLVLTRRHVLVGGALTALASGLGLAGCSRASSRPSAADGSQAGGGALAVAFDGAGVTAFARARGLRSSCQRPRAL